MMQDNIDISELYDSGAISGETYLYCVEHDILSLDDAILASLEDASELVVSEISELRKEYQLDVPVSDVSSSNPNDVIEEGDIDKYLDIINAQLCDSGSDVKKLIDELILHYGSTKNMIGRLLAFSGRPDIPFISNISITNANEILDLAYELQVIKNNYSIFDDVFVKCTDVRCTNVLNAAYKGFGNKLEFVNWLLRCSKDDLYRLWGAGERSVKIIWDIIQEIKEFSGWYSLVQEDSLSETITKMSIYLLSKGYLLPKSLKLDACAYLRDVLWYYNNDMDIFYYNIVKCSKKKDLPYYKNYPEVVLNTTLDIIYDLKVLGKKYSLFDECFAMCTDVRCANVLHTRHKYFGNKLEFINWFLSCSRVDLMKLANVGRKSIWKLWELAEDLREKYEENAIFTDRIISIRDDSRSNDENMLDLEKFEILVESKRKNLSVRANNVLEGILSEASYETLLKLFLSSDFTFMSAKNCGRKTDKELTAFKKEILLLVKTVPIEEAESLSVHDKYKSLLSLPDESVSDIITKHNESEHFPLFTTVQKYIDNLQHKDYVILQGMLDIYNGQELRHKEELGKELNLSGERVRQLRGKVLKHLKNYIQSIGRTENVSYYAPSNIEEINYAEGTNFQDNFIYWAISLVNNSWTIIGDIEAVFFNPHGHQVNLNIVPTALADSYKFDAFVEEFRRLYIKKRTVDAELNLQTFCMNFYKGALQIALLDDIVIECKKIILRLFDCTSRGEFIILESNAYRGLPEVMEEILENHGAPMTTEEIYKVLQEQYPEKKCRNIQSCKIHISKNERIVNLEPVGRKALFALVDWDTTRRNSSIREMAEDLMLKSEEKIISLEELGVYVRSFRPETSDASIRRNLISIHEGFSLYEKDSKQYIGFSARMYPAEYVPIEHLSDKRTVLDSCKAIEEFIIVNKRFPFLGDDYSEEENRLARFWQRTIKKKKEHALPMEELHEVLRIENEYELCNISKHEYNWREMYTSICKTLARYGWDALSVNEQHWCYKYLKLLRMEQLEDWQVPLMIKLQSLYA